MLSRVYTVMTVLSVLTLGWLASVPKGAIAAGGIPSGVLGSTGSLYTQERLAGLQLTVIPVYWDQAEPGNGSWNESYFSNVRTQATNARNAGLSLILEPAAQYVPSWVFSLDSSSSFVNQYGQSWHSYLVGSPNAVGADIPNVVWSTAVRNAEAAFLSKVFSELGTNWFAVRWGGGLRYNEISYPGSTSNSNCFWAYDANAQNPNNRLGNGVPASVRGWKPGTGSVTQAQTFISWYYRSLQGYMTWSLGTLRRSYSGEVWVLMPSWGVRPGDTTNAVNVLLKGSTYRSSEVAYGLDWGSQLPAYAQYGTITADVTWADAQDYYNDVQDWSPMHYISTILPSGVKLAGENTGPPSAGVSALNAFYSNVRAYGASRALWMNEAATQQAGNASLTDVGNAALTP